jgi:hypothetical protein
LKFELPEAETKKNEFEVLTVVNYEDYYAFWEVTACRLKGNKVSEKKFDSS